jgi:hypothetical protein
MIVTKLIGGLGNQMFQYAAGKSIALKNRCELLLDISALVDKSAPHSYRLFGLDRFELKPKISSIDFSYLDRNNKWKSRIKNFLSGNKNLTYVREKSFRYDPLVNELPDDIYLDGYWQCEKYFIDYEEDIRAGFNISIQKNDIINSYLRKAANSNSVSVHVRRGDYVNDPATNKYHGTCGIEYYHKAMQLIAERISDPLFFFFSDDMSWVKNNFAETNSIFVDDTDKNIPHEDLLIMSSCKNAIIANSSFSWWGAWLIADPRKTVIAPSKWFAGDEPDTTDLIPSSWLKI